MPSAPSVSKYARSIATREIRALGQTLNALAQVMETTVDAARPRMEAWRRHAADRELHQRGQLLHRQAVERQTVLDDLGVGMVEAAGD